MSTCQIGRLAFFFEIDIFLQTMQSVLFSLILSRCNMYVYCAKMCYKSYNIKVKQNYEK